MREYRRNVVAADKVALAAAQRYKRKVVPVVGARLGGDVVGPDAFEEKLEELALLEARGEVFDAGVVQEELGG